MKITKLAIFTTAVAIFPMTAWILTKAEAPQSSFSSKELDSDILILPYASIVNSSTEGNFNSSFSTEDLVSIVNSSTEGNFNSSFSTEDLVSIDIPSPDPSTGTKSDLKEFTCSISQTEKNEIDKIFAEIENRVDEKEYREFINAIPTSCEDVQYKYIKAAYEQVKQSGN